MKTNCMIVDDEPLAIEVLKNLIARIDYLEIAATCSNAIEAFNILKEKNVDLIFLDIQMPELTGIEFVRSLKTPPKIILTTAYREYAYQGFELDVVDYLLKPIPFDRFIKAIDKYFELTAERTVVKESPAETDNKKFIYLKADKKNHKIFLDDILFIESMRDYVIIFCQGKKLIVKNTLSNIEKILPENKFIRIHKSFIVSLDKIDSFTPASIHIGKRELTIGRNYKGKVFNSLNAFSDL